MTKTLIVIPARLAAGRLPQKPLALIEGVPMIVRVWRQAMLANVGPVIVACCGEEIASVVRAAGGEAIITDPDLPSGTDRVVAAMNQFDAGSDYDIVINLQGDLPTIDPNDVRQVMLPFAEPEVDIATLAAKIEEASQITNPNVVKIATGTWRKVVDGQVARAVYFSRQAIPANATEFYYHIGVYAYRKEALNRFVQRAPSYLEMTEKLEQLRALEAGMRIDVTRISQIPQSVDTPQDLERVVAMLRD
ncbi:3-deoxy-manno-octulosonate cytidylyltransferase [Candidatus Paracaedibacter symbiosus]|uniref:3-deoxy-manno-octulosonate cytidylyltransferase n=1 Tax=Candidatus Paracaedibacter symbiosus TaxID=244582 RepID=UPI0005095A01|nr:3-deoxy-manno-octulosonate cytidylyltransferase [Candidatus Paracaedibacter symbiosus]